MRFLIFILLLTLTMHVFAQNDRKYVRKGNSSYNDGNYQEAEVGYRKALERDPSSYKADYNLGNALYKQEQYDAAAGRYSALAEKETDHEKLSRYYYNLGNTMFESQKYKESAEAYKMALRNNPKDMDAKHNLQLALQHLREQQQQQQQNKDNQQGENDQDEQKKDQNDQQNQNPKQDEQKNDQNRGEQNNDDAQQPRTPKKGEITPEDAERILQALENEEKEVMKKVQERKEQTRKVPVDKNW
jgi:Ca-activated chloride channel homolog